MWEPHDERTGLFVTALSPALPALPVAGWRPCASHGGALEQRQSQNPREGRLLAQGTPCGSSGARMPPCGSRAAGASLPLFSRTNTTKATSSSRSRRGGSRRDRERPAEQGEGRGAPALGRAGGQRRNQDGSKGKGMAEGPDPRHFSALSWPVCGACPERQGVRMAPGAGALSETLEGALRELPRGHERPQMACKPSRSGAIRPVTHFPVALSCCSISSVCMTGVARHRMEHRPPCITSSLADGRRSSGENDAFRKNGP